MRTVATLTGISLSYQISQALGFLAEPAVTMNDTAPLNKTHPGGADVTQQQHDPYAPAVPGLWQARQIFVSGSFASRYSVPRTLALKAVRASV
jgi:hypothetical protein